MTSRVTANQKQLSLYEDKAATEDAVAELQNTTSTFAANLSLPIHRWFRYSAGFSATWVRELIEQEKLKGRRTLLDPFVGSGTTILEGEQAEMHSIGLEAHPFVARIARAKLMWHAKTSTVRIFAKQVLEHARSTDLFLKDITASPPLMVKCFPPDTLRQLLALRDSLNDLYDNTPASEITWLALIAILRECSPVGTAQWQYVLPNKTKARSIDPFFAFATKISMFVSDMEHKQRGSMQAFADLRQEDARCCSSIPVGWADLVVTSPPYANNYDYADATRLEMTFAGEIKGWGDLQSSVRRYLVRSCSQHVAPIVSQTAELLSSPSLSPIREEITEVCRQLGVERELHGGKKTYHTMIAAYFSDMAQVWLSLRRVTRPGALVCFVIGDSAPYGVYVPVDRWLGSLAMHAGFSSYSFEKLRDRNLKWKNRKHRVPLHEGRLWVQG